MNFATIHNTELPELQRWLLQYLLFSQRILDHMSNNRSISPGMLSIYTQFTVSKSNNTETLVKPQCFPITMKQVFSTTAEI